MIKQHENVVLSPFRLFLEDSKVMYLNNGNVQTCHIWMISLRQKLSDDVVRGGGTLRISGWECAAGTLEPLTFTRAS